MQCPSCNLFPGLDTQEPEVESLDVESDGRVTAVVRLVRNSACCGEEMKEARFDFDDELDVPKLHTKKGHVLSVTESNVEETARLKGAEKRTHSYFGVRLEYVVKCSCGKWELAGTMEDDMAASSFEALT